MYECHCAKCKGFCYIKLDPFDDEFVPCPDCHDECEKLEKLELIYKKLPPVSAKKWN